MDRRDRILSGTNKVGLGLEVAPWFNPLAPKREGYNVRTLDVFDFETLLTRAKEDPKIPKETYVNLEEIDYVGSACDIAQIVPETEHGTFEYIISSHNFEHLPDPIKFLQGCESLMQLNGHLSMAVPDQRGCFDYFRPWTVTADWLEAYVEGRKKPNNRLLFEDLSYTSSIARSDGLNQGTFPFDQPIESIRHSVKSRLLDMLKARFEDWQTGSNTGYEDCHCTVMTPSSLELMLLDCQMLGLIGLEIESIESFGDFEMFVRLRKPSTQMAVNANTYSARRNTLMRKTLIERKQAIVDYPSPRVFRAQLAPDIDGTTLIGALRNWNRARVNRRRAQR